MSPDEFTANAIAYLGTTHDWKKRISKSLDTDIKTIESALIAGPEEALAKRLIALIGEPAPQARHGNIVYARGSDEQLYILRFGPKHFTARVYFLKKADDMANRKLTYWVDRTYVEMVAFNPDISIIFAASQAIAHAKNLRVLDNGPIPYADEFPLTQTFAEGVNWHSQQTIDIDPIPKWLVGTDIELDRECLIHTETPRFRCFAVDHDLDQEYDLSDDEGFKYGDEFITLAGFEWFDKPAENLAYLLDQAMDAFEEITDLNDF